MSSYNETDPVPKDLDLDTPTEGATPPAEVNNAIREAKRVLKVGSAIITTSGNLQLTEQHSTVLINGAHTVTLPTIANVSSSTFTRRYRLIVISSSTGVLKTKASGETLNNVDYSSTGLNLPAQYKEYLIYGNGTVWYMEAVDIVHDATNWPSFRAHLAAGQVNITGLDQIEFNADSGGELFDTNNDYDTSTFRFTPSVAGKYLLHAIITCEEATYGTAEELQAHFYKNGASVSLHRDTAGTALFGYTIDITEILDANGSTDYFEIFLENRDRDSMDLSAPTVFMGSRIA